MISKKIFTTVLFIVWFIAGYSQQKAYVTDTVGILEIRDSLLCTVLNSFIVSEKECDYYTPDLIVSIHLQTWKDGHFITLSSNKKLGVVKERGLIYGGFMHNEHSIEVVINKDVNNSLKEQLFRKTNRTKIVKRYEPFNGYDSDKGIIIDLAEDDSFSFWRYFYQNGIFRIHERHTFCE